MNQRGGIPSLIGVIHLLPLPDSPRFHGSLAEVVDSAARDAMVLAECAFDAVIVENYGDAPFTRAEVSAATVAAMTRCALAVSAAAPTLELGINVLRNDAASALGIALSCNAGFVRVNVHTGARLTDQGVITGEAHDTLLRRRQLGLQDATKLLCDVAVKHSTALAPRPIAVEARETVERGLADAILVTGAGTGEAADASELGAVLQAVDVPVLVASGVDEHNLDQLSCHERRAHGVIVGSCLRASSKAGEPIDAARAGAFAHAFRRWEAQGSRDDH
jgi:membrane complex biogenesis BtpA family protein